ncbi:DegT/DnrJ/EryC1/StrS family aminotransferase [Desulfovibrio porci]|uniref:DegT/DnrJ/EryC1/StrS family aminotransferase n=1 Tax=Desulfovibrio porci TaxID=2605782 RepID=UPI003A919917
MTMQRPIYVTKTRLPELETFSRLCGEIFQRAWITNNGQCVQELERALTEYLGVSHVLACNNGTMGLMLAIQCAGLAGKKVAVMPYTYVAMLSALLWLHCIPVFVDIEPDTLCLSPQLLHRRFQEEPDIAGVLPVHIYGLACDVESLDAICREQGAILIYDAAQAFGSRSHGKSLLEYGDYSICSFHATKIFHTAEGGCVVSHSAEAHKAMSLTRAFGHINDTHYSLGISGKMSELHAAMGLSLLPGTDAELARRKEVRAMYDAALEGLPLQRPALREGLDWNSAYYPVLLPDEECRVRVEQVLKEHDIHPRRYFYPALNTLPYLKEEWRASCPLAEDAARRVLCLPMYGELRGNAIKRTAQALHAALPCDRLQKAGGEAR